MTEIEKTRRGQILAGILRIHPDKQGRYPTEWGTKTALGLYETVKRVIEDRAPVQGKE